MTNEYNPWLGMAENSRRRAIACDNHDLFWGVNLEGKYIFFLETKPFFENDVPPANLKGIKVIKRNSTDNRGELYLILNKKENWEIFHALCKDLLSLALRYESCDAMVSAVEKRLKQWQQLLKKDTSLDMNLQRQMGLFSELFCLQNLLIPTLGIAQSIVSWVGADFDKQDFLLDYSVIEVKSYRISKGPIVHISSLEQLYSDKSNIFLLSYGLTQTEKGRSAEDLIILLRSLMKEAGNEIKDIFDAKIFEYGFIPDVSNRLNYKFIVDKIQAFHVLEGFPRISRKDIPSQILEAKYSINLALCHNFEIEVSEIMEREK